jgi:2-polyprenyl-3-methyl-5-hydroxy-6-metoxy-1,4-benzoquinol methylase
MKDFREVVQDRFDREAGNLGIYAPDQPVGKYISKHLNRRLSAVFDSLHLDRKNCRVVDFGCGEGDLLKRLVSHGFSPKHLLGVDLSEKRIEVARKRHPELQFKTADVVEERLEEAADLILCVDVLSHLKNRNDIISALTSIRSQLAPNAYFIWYDIYSSDHFNAPEQADSWGFNAVQMNELAHEAGLEPVTKVSLFRKFFNKYHSAYQARRVPSFILPFMEKIIPGTPGNLMMVYKKRD